MTNCEVFLSMYRALRSARVYAPRGLAIRECEDYQMTLDALDSPLTSFSARNLNVNYAKAEFWWYLRGNRWDTYIEDRAKMWPKLKQPQGFYFSNYGQYIFGDRQFDRALASLVADRDSRQAVIVLLRPEMIFPENRDVVCTYSISFRIRSQQLNMSVNMRSNDAILGTTNDVFAFSMVHRMMLAALRSTYPDLVPGYYTHKVDSLHVYERHWDMLDRLCDEGSNGYYAVEDPGMPSPNEIAWLLGVRDGTHTRVGIPSDFRFTSWLADHG